MLENRTLGIWAIILGVLLNNLAYVIDLMKDDTGVIILGTKSLLGILIGILLILYGLFALLRRAATPG